MTINLALCVFEIFSNDEMRVSKSLYGLNLKPTAHVTIVKILLGYSSL